MKYNSIIRSGLILSAVFVLGTAVPAAAAETGLSDIGVVNEQSLSDEEGGDSEAPEVSDSEESETEKEAQPDETVSEELPETDVTEEDNDSQEGTGNEEQEEIRFQLPAGTDGWSRTENDASKVVWVLYEKGTVKEIWTWEKEADSGIWRTYQPDDIQLTTPQIPETGFYEIAEKEFYLEEGVPGTGWKLKEESGAWVFCKDKVTGTETAMELGSVEDPEDRQGLQTINGVQYYLDKSGIPVKNTKVDVDGVRYVLGADGKVTRTYTPVQEQWIHDSQGWWYKNDDGSYPADCWKEIDGQLYHFDARGYMTEAGWYLENGTWYYLTGSGAAAKGWLNLGNTWYYLGETTGKMATGWYQVKGTWYYSDGSGAMQTGWLNQGGAWYYLTGSGAMAEGWLNQGGTWYYLVPGNGRMLTGWYQVKGTWYYSNRSGAMQTGWLKQGGTWYYLAGSGAMQTGWLNLGGTKYYLKESGAMATGWLQLGDDWYYLGSDGAMYANCWVGNYYLEADGKWNKDKQRDELDILLQEVINQVTTAAMSNEGKLRACYDYVVNSFTYKRKYDFQNVEGWERVYALQMLKEKEGNCYNFAATFGCLAQKLGYSDVRTIAGATTSASGGWTPHSWVEIDMNGVTYIFDPEMEHAKGYDLYKKTYATSVLSYKKF